MAVRNEQGHGNTERTFPIRQPDPFFQGWKGEIFGWEHPLCRLEMGNRETHLTGRGGSGR